MQRKGFVQRELFNAATANFLQPSFVEGIPAFNGALWTIKIELSYYLLLPVLFVIMRGALLFPLLALSLLWAGPFFEGVLAHQLPGKLYLFGLGVMLARFPRLAGASNALPALLALPVLIVLKFAAAVPGGMVFEIAVGLCAVACVMACNRRWVNFELPDISYTLYLVHFPILVVLNWGPMAGAGFATTLIAGGLLSVLVAVLLTRLVERPGMRMARSLVAAHGARRASA